MIKGNLPSSDLHATLDDLLWTSKYRLQKRKWVFSMSYADQQDDESLSDDDYVVGTFGSDSE